MNQKPAYKHVKQKPYCCVPACISMILTRRRIKHGSQDDLGYELGLIVPKESVQFFKRVRTGKKSRAGWGSQVGKKKYSINKFFKKNKINLKEQHFSTKKVENAKKFIASNLKQGNDIIACFNNKKLHGKGDYGHVSLIQSINKNVIILIDPNKNGTKKRKVSLKKLINAMSYHRKKRGGFWLITNA